MARQRRAARGGSSLRLATHPMRPPSPPEMPPISADSTSPPIPMVSRNLGATGKQLNCKSLQHLWCRVRQVAAPSSEGAGMLAGQLDERGQNLLERKPWIGLEGREQNQGPLCHSARRPARRSSARRGRRIPIRDRRLSMSVGREAPSPRDAAFRCSPRRQRQLHQRTENPPALRLERRVQRRCTPESAPLAAPRALAHLPQSDPISIRPVPSARVHALRDLLRLRTKAAPTVAGWFGSFGRTTRCT